MKNKGFTLIEIMIVIALIVLLTSLTFPFSMIFLRGQIIEEKTISFVNNLKVAQSRSMTAKNDSRWGIKIEPEEEKYILFRGDSFQERDSDYDETFEISSDLEIGGDLEIVFKKLSGEVDKVTTITFKIEEKERTVEITKEGVITTE